MMKKRKGRRRKKTEVEGGKGGICNRDCMWSVTPKIFTFWFFTEAVSPYSRDTIGSASSLSCPTCSLPRQGMRSRSCVFMCGFKEIKLGLNVQLSHLWHLSGFINKKDSVPSMYVCTWIGVTHGRWQITYLAALGVNSKTMNGNFVNPFGLAGDIVRKTCWTGFSLWVQNGSQNKNMLMRCKYPFTYWKPNQREGFT